MATVVFRNGSLFDGHRYVGRVGAVVVSEGRVAAVIGDEAGALAGLGADVRVVDLDGGLLAPGFVDAHVHAVQGGLERIRCDLSGVHTREGYLAAIASYAAAHPEFPWILGGGWTMSAFPGGTPTGTLHEGAMYEVARHAPDTDPDEYYRALLAGQSYLHSLGVTGWQDAIVGDYAGMDDPGPTYLRAALSGDLTAHVVGALWWDRDREWSRSGILSSDGPPTLTVASGPRV